MKKKILPLITTAAVLSLSLSAIGADKHISVDGADIENSDVIEYEGHVCFPVRAVAESMGLSVEWIGETKTVVITNGGPIYVTFSIGEDAYTFAKTAPMPVGCPPVLVEGKTYAPIEVITELMGLETTEGEQTIDIILNKTEEKPDEVVSGAAIDTEKPQNSEEQTEDAAAEDEAEAALTAKGVVSEISDDGILFADEEKGDVRLVPADDAVIEFDDGTEAALDDIKEGSELTVVYGEIMSTSLPPVNNPTRITISK